MPFGMLSSHSRCHGVPPKEPWEYDEEFTDDFRHAVELKYKLMPYVYAQAKLASQEGYPMLRTLFFEYPEDPTSWFIEDEYLFGTDILVAPLMKEAPGRRVYLPPGLWTNYQSGETYEGARWHEIEVGEIPAVILVRDSSVIPHIRLAQSTSQMNWEEVELVVYGADSATAQGYICLPGDKVLHTLTLERDERGFSLAEDPLQGTVTWTIRQSE